MGLLTPARECTLWSLADARMAAAVDEAARARIERAIDLVPTVERTRTRDLWLVPSASDDGVAYHVYRGACHCRDAQQRERTNCKHALAVQLFQALERAEVDVLAADRGSCICQPAIGIQCAAHGNAAARLTITVTREEETLDLWPTDGEPCDLPAQCSRCHAEPRAPRHPDALCCSCIGVELFGEAL